MQSVSLKKTMPLARRLRLPSLAFCPNSPTPPQLAFMLLRNFEALYGGAAGGGKSNALLMAALQYVDIPGYRALLLRRRLTDLTLPGALLDRSHAWLQGTAVNWHNESKSWIFPSGATISFGYLDSENDKYRYQGAEFQFIGFDELTQFSESQYRYLLSRARKLKEAKVPIRVRAASNPGGIGHEWVKRRFVTEGRLHKRPFIPAKLSDNPYLDREQYEAALEQLDPLTRAQLRDGNWDIKADGNLFKRSWFTLVDSYPSEARFIRYWDLAAATPGHGRDPDYTVGALLGLKDGMFFMIDIKRMRGSPREIEGLIRQTAEIDGRNVPVFMEQEPGSSGINTIDYYARNVLVGFAFKGDRKTGSKVEMARPLSAALEAGNLKLVRGLWNGALIDEFAAFPQGGHDDQVDAVAGAFRKLSETYPVAVKRISGLW